MDEISQLCCVALPGTACFIHYCGDILSKLQVRQVIQKSNTYPCWCFLLEYNKLNLKA